MNSRKASGIDLAVERVSKLLSEGGANSRRWVAPGRPSRLMPGPDDMPHYKSLPMNPPKTVLGCHPRLLSRLLS